MARSSGTRAGGRRGLLVAVLAGGAYADRNNHGQAFVVSQT
jgi:hypothetical protein